jgi:hypothetical protein
MVNTYKYFFLAVAILGLNGCVCLNPAHKRISPPPINPPPPVTKIDRLEGNVRSLDEALKQAKTSSTRIRILTQQLEFNNE